jgi:hypothetical protein
LNRAERVETCSIVLSRRLGNVYNLVYL